VILLAGGTGTLGRPLVRAVTGAPGGLRVLTRDGAAADRLGTSGIETVVGDVRDPATRAAAVAGCETVVAAVHGFIGARGAGPEEIDRDATVALIGAAVTAGVRQLVLISAYAAAPTHPMSLHRMKYAAEQALIGSGLRWSILRPTAYLETWLDVLGSRLTARRTITVFGKGRNPINFVSVEDVARAAVEAIDGGSEQRILDVTGPANLELRDIAEKLSARCAPPARIAHVPLGALRAMAVLARPVSPAFARQTQAAILMDTTDMTAPPPAGSSATTLDQVLESRAIA